MRVVVCSLWVVWGWLYCWLKCSVLGSLLTVCFVVWFDVFDLFCCVVLGVLLVGFCGLDFDLSCLVLD